MLVNNDSSTDILRFLPMMEEVVDHLSNSRQVHDDDDNDDDNACTPGSNKNDQSILRTQFSLSGDLRE
jgi:hypothetical protein